MKKTTKAFLSLMLSIILIAAMCLNVYAYQADMKTMSYQYGSNINHFYGRLYVIDVGDFYGSSLAEGSAETDITFSTSAVTYLKVRYWFELDSDPSVKENTLREASVSGMTNTSTNTFDDTITSARCDRLKAIHTIRYRIGGSKYEVWEVETVEEGVFYP